jgi:hypothetical protein
MRTSILAGTILLLTSCVRGQEIKPLDPVDKTVESKMQLVDKYDFEVKGVGKTTVNLFMPMDWGDAGDFLKINITNDKYSVSFSNTNGWVRFDNNYSVSDNLKKTNELKTDKLILVTNKNTSYLIMFGWVYANEPGLCTIIDLKTGKIVFNTEKDLISISSDKSTFEFRDKYKTTLN